MIELDVSAWTGLKLVQNGQTHSVSVFSSDTADMLASSPAAADAFGTYRALRITGTILYLLGTSALVATLVILAADRDILVDDSIKGAFWGLFIPGATLGVALGVMGVLTVLLMGAVGMADAGPHTLRLGLTVGAAVAIIVVWGTLIGSLFPLLLDRIGIDPATSSSPLVTTLMDVSGLTIYFALALLVLSGTLL